MEIGSVEHKQLLLTGIIKVSVKIASLGLFLGVLLMIPMFIRENTFSTGLYYAGIAIILSSSFYALFLGYRKYRAIIQPFNKQYSK